MNMLSREKTIKKKESPQEEKPDSMTIIEKFLYKKLWRPNNYRRQIRVSMPLNHLNNSTPKEIKGTIGSFPVEITKRSRLIIVRNYNGVTIQYGKKTVTAMYSQNVIDGEKEVFCVNGNSLDDIENWIKNKKKEINRIIDNALFKFIMDVNIIKRGEKPIWVRHEDWTNDEEINKIPEWEIVHGEHFKKVYAKGIEFIGGKNKEPTDQLINRIRNSGLKDFSPDIVNAIDGINVRLDRLHALKFLKNKVRCPADIIRFKEYVVLLSESEKDEFSAWIFDNVAVNGLSETFK